MEDGSNLSPIDLLNCCRTARVNLGSDVPREESRTLAIVPRNFSRMSMEIGWARFGKLLVETRWEYLFYDFYEKIVK